MNDKPLQKLLKLSDAQVQRLREFHWDVQGAERAEPSLLELVRQSVIDVVGEDAEQVQHAGNAEFIPATPEAVAKAEALAKKMGLRGRTA